MGKHEELPITTIEKVDFDSYKIYRSEALPLYTQIHGIIYIEI